MDVATTRMIAMYDVPRFLKRASPPGKCTTHQSRMARGRIVQAFTASRLPEAPPRLPRRHADDADQFPLSCRGPILSPVRLPAARTASR